MQQPYIDDDLIQKLNRIAAAYEMTSEAMLNHIVTVALDELDGKQDDYTVCVPVTPVSAGKPGRNHNAQDPSV